MAKRTNASRVIGVKRQRMGAFRDWRSKLGGGWRLDDDGHNASLLPKSTKVKVRKVKPTLITQKEHSAQVIRRSEQWRKSLNLPSIGKLTIK